MTREVIVRPHSVEAEEAVLGSLLIDPEAIARVAGFLAPEHFYIVKNQWVYEAMLRLTERREPIDLLTVCAELASRAKLDEAGGESYIAQLTDAVPTALNVVSYARTVKSMAQRRRIIHAASDVARIAFATDLPIEDVIARSQSAINDAANDTDLRAMTWQDAIVGFMEELESFVYADSDPPTFGFGIRELDALLGDSLLPGNLVLVAAKKKRGKSTLMRQHMVRNAKGKTPCAAFSFEEHEFNIVKSVLAKEAFTEVSRTRLRDMLKQGKTAEVEDALQRIRDASQRVYHLPIHPCLAAGWSIDRVLFQMEYLARAHGVRVFEVDYAQLIRTAQLESRRIELAHISNRIAAKTKELRVFTLMGSQVNDEGRTREAEDLENECDAKILIEPVETLDVPREGRYPVALHVELNRHGATGKIPATFDKPRATFGGQS